MSEYSEAEFVDYYCYYRNLAIQCGAAPEDMRNTFDAGICRQGIPDSKEYPDERKEMNDLWVEHEELQAKVECMKRNIVDIWAFQKDETIGALCEEVVPLSEIHETLGLEKREP